MYVNIFRKEIGRYFPLPIELGFIHFSPLIYFCCIHQILTFFGSTFKSFGNKHALMCLHFISIYSRFWKAGTNPANCVPLLRSPPELISQLAIAVCRCHQPSISAALLKTICTILCEWLGQMTDMHYYEKTAALFLWLGKTA